MKYARSGLFMIIAFVFILSSCSSGDKTKLTSKEVQEMDKSMSVLEQRLANEIAEKNIQIKWHADAVTINIVDSLFFESGNATIKPRGLKTLEEIGVILKQLPSNKIIRIEGHTDNVAIGNTLKKMYNSNWEMGAARASAVAENLVKNSGIDPEKIVVVSYSKYRPIVPNTSPENRSINRRIEIVVMNRLNYEAKELESSGQAKDLDANVR
jgi:chemotaxis protein MotB